MQINSLNSFNYNQNFRAAIKLRDPNMKDFGKRACLAAGAVASGLCANYIQNLPDVPGEAGENGTVASGCYSSAVGLGASVFNPKLFDKFVNYYTKDEDDQPKIPS